MDPSSIEKGHHWFEVAFTLPNDEVDAVAGILALAGHRACELREAGEGKTDLVIYLATTNDGEARRIMRSLAEQIPHATVLAQTTRPVAEEIWRENWKRFFPSVEIGRRLVVLPPWIHTSTLGQGERTRVVIDPGMAFGTGHHATTHGCLEALDELVAPDMVIADVGCGTGILAIAALRLGASRAVATDEDPLAIDATRANAARNGVADRLTARVHTGPPLAESGAGGGFDIVTANLHTQVLLDNRAGLTSCVRPGGHLVLSGIEGESQYLIERSFVGAEWAALRITESRDWVTVTLRRARKQPPTGSGS
jgi:ribosomal protein L11 methyltransferase